MTVTAQQLVTAILAVADPTDYISAARVEDVVLDCHLDMTKVAAALNAEIDQ